MPAVMIAGYGEPSCSQPRHALAGAEEAIPVRAADDDGDVREGRTAGCDARRRATTDRYRQDASVSRLLL